MLWQETIARVIHLPPGVSSYLKTDIFMKNSPFDISSKMS